jgi:CspA family cold shock protein
MNSLRENQRVAYDLEADRRGKMAATNLRSAEDSAQDSAGEQAPEAEADGGDAE